MLLIPAGLFVAFPAAVSTDAISTGNVCRISYRNTAFMLFLRHKIERERAVINRETIGYLKSQKTGSLPLFIALKSWLILSPLVEIGLINEGKASEVSSYIDISYFSSNSDYWVHNLVPEEPRNVCQTRVVCQGWLYSKYTYRVEERVSKRGSLLFLCQTAFPCLRAFLMTIWWLTSELIFR